VDWIKKLSHTWWLMGASIWRSRTYSKSRWHRSTWSMIPVRTLISQTPSPTFCLRSRKRSCSSLSQVLHEVKWDELMPKALKRSGWLGLSRAQALRVSAVTTASCLRSWANWKTKSSSLRNSKWRGMGSTSVSLETSEIGSKTAARTFEWSTKVKLSSWPHRVSRQQR